MAGAGGPTGARDQAKSCPRARRPERAQVPAVEVVQRLVLGGELTVSHVPAATSAVAANTRAPPTASG